MEKKIGIVGNRLFPLNEGYANQAKVLSRIFNADIFTCNTLNNLFFTKKGKYFIVNTKFIAKKYFPLSILNIFLLYVLLKKFEHRHNLLFLMGGIESKFLRVLTLKKTIPIITTIDSIRYLKFFVKISEKMPSIIVQSKKVRDIFVSKGISANKLLFFYPFVDLNRFSFLPAPKEKEFSFLFASSPNVIEKGKDNFSIKGVPLLLKSFKKFLKKYDAKLYIVWRGIYTKKLYNLISKLSLEKEVIIIDKQVSMKKIYTKIHATLIPYTSSYRSPQYPLSALESLISGRPVVTTSVIELSEFISSLNVGVSAKPKATSFSSALNTLVDNYTPFKKNCKKVRRILRKNENLFIDYVFSLL